MKRYTFLIMLLVALILSACGSGGETEPAATAAPPEAAPTGTAVPVEEIAPTATPEPPEEISVGEPEAEAVASGDDSADEVILVPTATPAEEAQTENAPAEGGEYANTEQGIASYLSDALHGAATANGATYDKNEFVAAHKDLPFDTEVRVTNLANGKSVTVTIIDRMPANNPHLIDVSYVAAVELEMLDAGNIDAMVEWHE